MKKLLGIAIVLIVVSVPVLCQDFPKAEVFGGYQYTRISPGNGISGENFNGWNAAVTGNINHWLGVTGDVGGAYKDFSGVSVKNHTFLFGPTIAAHGSEKFTPFAHALFGVSHETASGLGLDTSDNAFAMALGGGVDLGMRNFAIRVGQFDYLMTRFGGTRQNNFRYSAGIVFRF